MKFRRYIDGKLIKSTEVDREHGIRWLNNMQKEWEQNIRPSTIKDGEFDPNLATYVHRNSMEELEIHTTGGHKLIAKLTD